MPKGDLDATVLPSVEEFDVTLRQGIEIVRGRLRWGRWGLAGRNRGAKRNCLRSAETIQKPFLF